MSVRIHHGDSRDVLRTIAEATFDSCVTDPPYALVSITKRFGNADLAAATKTSERTRGRVDGYSRLVAGGFMGAKWDTGETAFDPTFWEEVLRVLKPGAHLVAFGGTRTYHRMACAIEDAGFEIRDQLQWLYGSGFPKSHKIGEGWGTALKPACEPIVLARKPFSEKTVAANVLMHGTGAINIDGCRVETGEARPAFEYFETGSKRGYDGGIKGGAQIGTKTTGRWPANVVHDGSDEVLAGFPDRDGCYGPPSAVRTGGEIFKGERGQGPLYPDSGSAARFFYSAKADSDDRLGSNHPTVKPVDLLQWLVRLVTRKGGLVLDPFAGTGTTGEAAYREGCEAVLIEREAKFVADITRRVALLDGSARERRTETVKAKKIAHDPGPLFAKPQAGG